MSVLESARLRLRELSDADAPFIVALLNDPDFRRYVGDRGVRNEQDALGYLAHGPLASYARHGFGLWLVELRSSATAIGMCGLLRRDTHPDVEIGFAYLPQFRRQGYALEAASATMQLATQKLELSRVIAITAPDNAASGAILERLGFRFERLVRYTDDGESRLFVYERRPAAQRGHPSAQ